MVESRNAQNLAIVTGGSRGIGASIVTRLASAGFRVVFFYKQNAGDAAQLVESIARDGRMCAAMQVDVSKATDVIAAKRTILEDYGPPNVIVNNAGVINDALVFNLDNDQWSTVLNTNLGGAFNVIRTFSEPMLDEGGSIVNISSVAGLVGVQGQSNYCASKFGLIGLTKSAAKELGPFGIRVNAVAPGYIKTDMIAASIKDNAEILSNRVPLKRLGTPADVAATVEFLVGEGARYITGTVITVDGGLTA